METASIILREDNYLEWCVNVKQNLKAQGLWDILTSTARPSNQEQDEVASKTWREQNFKALQVICNSCGSKAFSMIHKTSSAAEAWNILAKKYIRSSIRTDNFMDWRVRVETYLEEQNLRHIIEPTTNPPRSRDGRRENTEALQVIQKFCGRKGLSKINGITLARRAWKTLKEEYEQDNISTGNFPNWSARMKAYLLAHDLWSIVESTTNPPRKEDDEAAFANWKTKNFKALQAIRKFCGWKTLPEINKISSARDAWKTLVEKYDVRNGISKENYTEWRARVKSELMDRDLWNAIESTANPPKLEDDEVAFTHWIVKNSEALQVIRNSCGWKEYFHIQDVTSAKVAWDTLSKKYDKHEQISKGRSLADAVKGGDLATVKKFLEEDHDAVRAKITFWGETALHIAVAAGKVNVVQALVQEMTEEDLEITDAGSNTALAQASLFGNCEIAKCMVDKNKRLVQLTGGSGRIPVVLAIECRHKELADYLYKNTPLEVLKQDKGIHGATVCTQAIYNGMLDIALRLIESHRPLALALDMDNRSPLYALASMPYAFSSGNQLMFCKQWICAAPSASNDTHVNIDIEQVPTNGSGVEQLEGSLSGVLLNHMWEQISISTNEDMKNGRVFSSVTHATREGMVEFVYEILKRDDGLMWIVDHKGRTIFSNAVLYREAKIFTLLFEFPGKDAIINTPDKEKNNILHMAGMLAPSTQLNLIPGAALQMQRELQWFKKVESIVPHNITKAQNKDGLTPKALFTERHEDLRRAGEQWMRSTSTSCTVVGALIITTMFTAAFNVPGGRNPKTGLPIFLNQNLFKLFMVCDSLSLLSSSTSVLMFLGILTSRYAEEDFLKSLPTKIIVGLSTLFFSIATMMMAFCAALVETLHGQTGTFIPIVCLAGVPVTLFAAMQFRLLIDIYISTYRSGVFDKK